MRYIEFNIKYEVNDDSVIYLHYSLSDNGYITNGILSLRQVQRGWWQGGMDVNDEFDSITYGYELITAGKAVASEWGSEPHYLRFNCVNRNYIMHDMWLDSPVGYYKQTNLFRFFDNANNRLDEPTINWYNRSVTFSLYVTGLRADEHLYIAGDATVLGRWNTEKALRMQQCEPNLWTITFDVENIWCGGIYYKFIAKSDDGSVRWEEGDNRHILLPNFDVSSNYCYRLDELHFPAEELRVAGTVIPLFSLRSEHGWGIGDFGDIKLMTDWLVSTGQNILQLLPVNDTTVCGGNEDSYPYNCISVFALNPIYADMSELPELTNQKRLAYYRKESEQLNKSAKVNYAKVYMLKIGYLRELFEELGEEILATAQYKEFVTAQEQWLKPYTLFRFLSSRLHCNIWDWKEYPHYDETTWGRVVAEYPDAVKETSFYSFVQFILYNQLCNAHEYANANGVALKGDIPIGVAPNGVDVWCDREQFNLSVSAGAPPDMFSADGQNWGFPTYNWRVMAADGYSWWRRRLQYMSCFFDAYRIDHVLGFFRIWEIPRTTKSGLAGSFSPNMPLTKEEICQAGFPFDENKHAEKYIDEAHLRLDGNVLFMRDLENHELFIPRILGYETKAYMQLTQQERIAYNHIYEDYYYNRHTMFWYREGMKKLAPLLQSTTMTACAEDLGMIPACVPWVMKNLQVLSLEIQRMPKLYGETFASPQRYPYLSVATPSTHDMSTLRGWWREDEAMTQLFYNNVLKLEGKAPAEMDGNTAHAILMQHLTSPSAFALFAWQDWMAMDERLRYPNPDDERINVPSNRDHVWNYRMHITIEQLMQERTFNDAVRRMITDAGRLINRKEE